jgi:hypothetical protein
VRLCQIRVVWLWWLHRGRLCKDGLGQLGFKLCYYGLRWTRLSSAGGFVKRDVMVECARQPRDMQQRNCQMG